MDAGCPAGPGVPSAPARASQLLRKPSRVAITAEAVALLTSLGWAVTHRHALAAVQHRLHGVGVVAGLLVVCAVCYIGGFLLLAASIGTPLVRRRPATSTRGGSTVRRARDVALRAIDVAPSSPSFRVGWWLTSVGAVGPGLVLATGVLVGLPATDRPLAVLPAVDAAVSIVLRTLVSISFSRRHRVALTAAATEPAGHGLERPSSTVAPATSP